jgi:hypothetical protein
MAMLDVMKSTNQDRFVISAGLGSKIARRHRAILRPLSWPRSLIAVNSCYRLEGNQAHRGETPRFNRYTRASTLIDLAKLLSFLSAAFSS